MCGSVARHQARADSDIDLIVEAPTFGFVRFKQLIEQVLGQRFNLIAYGGLKPRIDGDIRREAVLLCWVTAMGLKATKEVLHIQVWLDRVEEIVKGGKRAYLGDDVLQRLATHS